MNPKLRSLIAQQNGRKNQYALEASPQADEETVYAPVSNRDSETKVTKTLKTYREKVPLRFSDVPYVLMR